MAKNRNVVIQLMRVCASFMVFIVHFGQRVNFNGILRDFTDFGKFGVQIFFLISGFLAGKVLYNNSKVNIKEYYIKRMVAILPLYYLVIAYYFVSENILNQFVSIIPPDEFGIGWFRYIFLLNGFFKSDTYFWSNLGITWTIPIFMFFYLIAPWVLRKVKTLRLSVTIWLGIFVLTEVLNCVFTCTIFNNLHFLFLGVVIYACVNQKRHKQAIVIFSLAAIGMMILQNETCVYVFLFACIMLALLSIDNIILPNWVQKVIDILDEYSYTLYLMHGVIFCSFIDRINMLGVSKIIVAMFAIIGTFLATWVVGRFIEKPIQKRLRKHLLK